MYVHNFIKLGAAVH